MKKKKLESSQPEKLVRMRQEDIVLTEEMKEELKALKKRKIDFSDIPEVTDFSNFVTGKFYRPRKVQLTMRLDANVLDWLKKTGKKYQTFINEICKEYMLEHMKKEYAKKKEPQKTKKRSPHAKKI